MKKRIERKMIVYEICLDKIINYSNKVFDIDEKFRKLIRDNSDSSKVKAYTGAKTMFASTLCGHKSINELNDVNKQKRLRFDSLYRKNEFVPCTHGLRDCIIDTDYQQMVEINKSVIQKTKINKIFKKNKIDGLTIMAVDGVDLNETNKEIEGLPEREHKNGHITKYLKNTAFMNVGPLANIIIGMYQHQEIEKITTESGKERAKSNGETKAFEEMIIENEKLIGGVIDGFTLDGLYTNKNVFNLINSMGKYFINRLKNKRLNIYKDAERLFENRKQDYTYELVKIATRKNYKYSKKAKKKDVIKNKIRIEKRDISNNKLGEKRLVNKRTQTRKNSTIEIEIYETVITRKEVWEDIFNMDGYEGDLRVVKSKEISLNGNEEITQEIYVITNMLTHDVETILKIMHYRWNIENCGFRTLKQRFNIGHIYIGDINAIKYIIQMKILVFNLLELYMKIRLKNEVKLTWLIITKLFERAFHNDKEVKAIYMNSG